MWSHREVCIFNLHQKQVRTIVAHLNFWQIVESDTIDHFNLDERKTPYDIFLNESALIPEANMVFVTSDAYFHKKRRRVTHLDRNSCSDVGAIERLDEQFHLLRGLQLESFRLFLI